MTTVPAAFAVTSQAASAVVRGVQRGEDPALVASEHGMALRTAEFAITLYDDAGIAALEKAFRSADA